MRLSVAIIILLSTCSARGQTISDTAMTDLAQCAFSEANQNPDSALSMSSRALQQYQRSGNMTLGGLAYKARGWAYLHLGNYDSSFANLKQSAALFKRANDTVELMLMYLNIANAYSLNSQFGKSVEYVLQADALADKSNNLKAKGGVKNQMGILFREQRQYPKAVVYFKEAIESYRMAEDTLNYIGSIGSLCILYNNISKPDSSLAWLKLCVPIISALNGHDYAKAKVYERLGDTWLAAHQYDKALDNYKHAYELFGHTGNKGDQAFEAIILGAAFIEAGRPKDAEYYLLQSYQVNDSLHITNHAYDAAAELADLYQATKEWQKAYHWLNTARSLLDTLNLAEQNEKTAELQAKYEAEKKDKQIELLKKDQDLRTADVQKERAIKISAFILSGLLILVGFLIVNRYRLIQKTRRLVEIEKLRNSIARDLHDDIGSTLSSIHINSNMALSHPEEEQVVKGQLEKIQKNAGRMMESMGDIVWAINPANDSVENLLAKMKEFLAEVLEPLNISYCFTDLENLKKIKFDIGRRKEFYLVFKEAVNNAAKYSRCTAVNIDLTTTGDAVILQVTDNGNGFDLQNTRQGNGLRNMQQRAAQMGGTLDIVTARGKGTTITLYIPVT